METLINKLNIETISLLVFGLSFVISYLTIPKLIDIIKYKDLMDHPNARSSHYNKTPTLAGVVFYISAIASLFIIHFIDNNDISFNVLIGLTILFFVGLKDDLMILSAKTKVLAQLLAITFILLNFDMSMIKFHGFLGITEIPLVLSIAISYFVAIFIINAYNLMDGIDGLAGMLGILILSIYALLFYNAGIDYFFLIAIMSIGFLIAFLRFNLSNKKKIFMGDTGSMIVGFIIGFLTLRLLAMNVVELNSIHIKPQNLALVTLSILFFPIFDVSRVIIIRRLKKRAIFKPDRCHMHHILIDKGLTHIKASKTIVLSNLLICISIYSVNTYLNIFGLFILFIILSFVAFLILMVLDRDGLAIKNRKKFKALFPRYIQNREFRIRKKIIWTLKNLFYKNKL